MNLVTRSTVIQLASDDNLIAETTDVIINFSACKASDYSFLYHFYNIVVSLV